MRQQTNPVRYVAVGDSFTEGVGGALVGERVRGWADLVADGDAGKGPELLLEDGPRVRNVQKVRRLRPARRGRPRRGSVDQRRDGPCAGRTGNFPP